MRGSAKKPGSWAACNNFRKAMKGHINTKEELRRLTIASWKGSKQHLKSVLVRVEQKIR